MAIFRLNHDLKQDVVVQALVDGATLMPKGALTYWYNCRRKFRKEKLVCIENGQFGFEKPDPNPAF